jgi:hypothetical protein
LTALQELKFIILENGDEVVFQLEKDNIGILWNKQFQFYKIDD